MPTKRVLSLLAVAAGCAGASPQLELRSGTEPVTMGIRRCALYQSEGGGERFILSIEMKGARLVDDRTRVEVLGVRPGGSQPLYRSWHKIQLLREAWRTFQTRPFVIPSGVTRLEIRTEGQTLDRVRSGPIGAQYLCAVREGP